MTKFVLGLSIVLVLVACNAAEETSQSQQSTYPDVQIAGAMKNVMWKGELDGIIHLDTIQNKKGLYGIGPESFLTGELLIKDGVAYVSRVLTDTVFGKIKNDEIQKNLIVGIDTTAIVEKTFDVSAPFFVYGNVNEWNEMKLIRTVKNIVDLEKHLDELTKAQKRPFVFKLSGRIAKASVHIQNLPKGTKVSSPKEAHQGQVGYQLENTDVDIIGFFSTAHKGIFTHHDTYLHMHLITKDESIMGHLDDIEFGQMTLFLPVK